MTFVAVQTCEVYTTSVGNKQLPKPRRSPEKGKRGTIQKIRSY